jgi:hypothetical protein
MKTKIVARVALMVPWPKEHSNHYRCYPTERLGINGPPKTVGDMIVGIGKPREPDLLWNCGTDLVWPVYELNGKPLEPLDGNRYPHVCRHQIVAGD